jgi:hypothetical protein
MNRARPTLTVVQTPAAPAPQPWPHPDTRATAARRAAWQAGYDAAERHHHVRGWRLGIAHGLLAGIVLGLLAAAAWLAMHPLLQTAGVL